MNPTETLQHNLRVDFILGDLFRMNVALNKLVIENPIIQPHPELISKAQHIDNLLAELYQSVGQLKQEEE